MTKNESLGLTDRMTGMRNYECFVSELDEMVAEALEKNEDLTLAMIDIDHFANVNNQYGHAVGDEVLMSVVEHLAIYVPENSNVYRYAGEQFAILLPNTEKEKAFLMMEKLRESYKFTGKDAEGRNIEVTFSTGISSCPEDGSRINEIVRKSEGALFRAKKSGRNKVSLSREEKMITKTSHYTYEQLQRLSELAKKEGTGEAVLLREALDDLLKKYDY
jgi:diguanylate cyclase (GGDEF)-like protein